MGVLGNYNKWNKQHKFENTAHVPYHSNYLQFKIFIRTIVIHLKNVLIHLSNTSGFFRNITTHNFALESTYVWYLLKKIYSTRSVRTQHWVFSLLFLSQTYFSLKLFWTIYSRQYVYVNDMFIEGQRKIEFALEYIQTNETNPILLIQKYYSL